jgi:hypothetical protein
MVGVGMAVGALVGTGLIVGLAASTVAVPVTRTASSTSSISPVKMLLILIIYHPLYY